MGDLTKGETFAAGEVVTADRLHALVNNATINNGAVGTAKLADGSVTSAKLAAGITTSTASIQIATGKTIIGNGSGVGDQVTIDTGTLATSPTLKVKDAGIAATQLAADAVTTAKILDGNVTGAKLETLSPSPAGTYGSASQVPVVTVDAKGRVTGMTTASVRLELTQADTAKAVPAANGVTHFTWAGGSPKLMFARLRCTTAHSYWQVGDLLDLGSVWAAAGSDSFPPWGLYYDAAGGTVSVSRANTASLLYAVIKAGTGGTEAFVAANWELAVYVIV